MAPNLNQLQRKKHKQLKSINDFLCILKATAVNILKIIVHGF